MGTWQGDAAVPLAAKLQLYEGQAPRHSSYGPYDFNRMLMTTAASLGAGLVHIISTPL